MKEFIARRLHIVREFGDSSRDIFSYWLPELISNAILVTLPPFIDGLIVAQLGSIVTYGALGSCNQILHNLTKVAEAIPVAAIAVIGRYNGAGEHEKCGESLGDTFWTTFLFGLSQFLLIFFGGAAILGWLGVHADMVSVGAPFLTLKSFGFMLMFIALGLLAFMRAVKNTRVPMIINMVGIGAFIFFDYSLVLGKFGFDHRGVYGAAIATIIQYTIMNALALGYILTNPDYKKYFSRIFFSFFNFSRIGHLINISWPIVFDKSTIAFAYVWLLKMINPLGKQATASFTAVQSLERTAFLPAMASAGILTFLVSNRIGAKDPEGVVSNIKKVLLLTFVTVVPSLTLLCMNSRFFVQLFDPTNQFTYFAAAALPVISILAIFDFTQVVLAAALRGAGDTRTVMVQRAIAVFLFFIPVSYFLSHMEFANPIVKFVLIYGSFYITTGLMGVSYLFYIKSRKWQNRSV